MSMPTKTDYFGIADSTSIVCTSSNEGASAQEVTIVNEAGDIVVNEVIGTTSSPSCDYKLKADVGTGKNVVLGGVTTTSSKSIVLTNVSISTSAGGEPTISASGVQVQSAATANCHYTQSIVGLTKLRHAQTLFSAFTVSSGAYLQSANYTIGCDCGITTKDGDPIAFDCSAGYIECTISVRAESAPTITAGTNWTITAPITCSSPDADYSTWTCTLKKYLSHDVQGQ